MRCDSPGLPASDITPNKKYPRYCTESPYAAHAAHTPGRACVTCHMPGPRPGDESTVSPETVTNRTLPFLQEHLAAVSPRPICYYVKAGGLKPTGASELGK